jgi:arylsulfatase A-like enzyme
MDKPNIGFIFTDQQRSDTIHEEITPNLWNFAQNGVHFTNAFTCQPL